MATISNSNSNSLVVGTAGDDSINNFADFSGRTTGRESAFVTVDGAAGNDTIDNGASFVTIDGGAGDDLIFAGDGYTRSNDYIVFFGDNNISINGDAGNDTINNYQVNFITIDGGTGDDSINNSGTYLESYDGSNRTLRGTDVLINGDDGNDSIRNNGTNITINGGDGNDTIGNSVSYTLADDGTPTDTIQSDNVTINGGAGNDDIYTISDGAHTYIYNEGDGHDTISSSTPDYNADVITTWNYSNNFSLQINSASPWSSVVSGNNIVITVGDGSITLVDAATSSGININGVTYPIDATATTPADTSTATTPADTSTATTPADTSTATTPADTSTATTPADTSTATTPADTSTATTPADTSTATTPADTLPPAVGGAAYDIVFFVDVSGSMRKYIDQVNAIAQTFVDKLKERGITDYRLAAVDYETAFNVYFGADGSPFTQDVDTFKSWMAQAAEKSSSTGGGNENALYAINHVLNNFPFNPTANKEFIVLTDENFYDGQTFDLDVTEQFMAANSVQLDVIGEVNGSCDSAWTPVARNTGGNFYDINGNYAETFNEIVLNLDCVNVNLSTVPDGQTGWFFVVPGNHVTDLKSVDAVFVNAADPNLEAYAQVLPVVGMVSADKVYSGNMSAYRQNITIPDMWNVTATSHADILNVAGTGFGVMIASGDGHDAVKLGDAATGIILTDHSLDDDGLEFSRRQALGTFTENVTTDLGTMTNQVALTSPTMAVYLQNFSSPLQEEFDAKNEQFMAYGVTNGGTTNTVYELLFGTEPTPEPSPESVTPVAPPIVNDALMGRIMFAQWGYGFTPPPTNPLYDATTDATTETTASTITTETLATSADIGADFGSPSLDEISPVNFAVTQDNFTAQNFNVDFAVTQANKLLTLSKPKFC